MKKLKVNGPVLIFIILHTVIVSFFVFILTKGGVPLSLFAICAAVCLSLITAYTTFRISRIVYQEISDSLNAVLVASARLKVLSVEMYGNAKELENNAARFYSYAAKAEGMIKTIAPDKAIPDDGTALPCIRQTVETGEDEPR